MSSEWETLTLRDFVEHQKGFAFKSKDYSEDGVQVVRVSDFTSDSIDDSNLKFVPENVANANRQVSLDEGDVIVATVGSWPTNPASVVGKTIRVPSKNRGALLNQNAVRLRVKSSHLDDQTFLYYLLKNSEFAKFIVSTAQGSASQASITLNDIYSYEFTLPPQKEKKLICETLFGLDEKISKNICINSILEQIAQAIFKSWFVDFEPTKAKIGAREALLAENPAATPEQIATAEKQAAIQAIAGAGDVIPTEQLQIVADLFPNQLVESELGEIPDGWCIKNLEQICSLASGKLEIKSLTANNYISTENMLENRGGVKQASSLPTSKTVSEFKKGDILISNIRPYFKKIWLASFDGGRSNDVLCFRGINKISSCFLYCLLNRDEFFDFMMQTSKGAKMPRGDKQAIMRKAEVVPAYELQNYFSKLVRNFFNLIVENKKQNESLTMLRDTLLPKLLAGEIHID